MGRNKERNGIYWNQYRELRAQVLFEQDFGCWDCGTKLEAKRNSYHLHHLDKNPKNNYRSNLVVVCKVCHMCLHDWDVEHWKKE